MKTISQLRIVQLLRADGVGECGSFFGDQLYAVPTENWFLKTFAPDLIRALGEFGVSLNTGKDSWDCDDLAGNFALFYARWLHHKSKAGNHSIAIGRFAYLPDNSEVGHVILVGLCGNSLRPEPFPVYYDPSLQQRVNLSPVEKSICYAYLF